MNPIRIAKSDNFLSLLPTMANRHGLIAGATGTGKTVTLQTLAEGFSTIGVPVFMADVKGDLYGMSQVGCGNPKVNLSTAITELGVGEALVSFLDEKGIPSPVERAYVCPPQSRIGPASDAERAVVMSQSLVAGVYEKAVDRESAYEELKKRAGETAATTEPKESEKGFDWGGIFGGKRSSRSDSVLESAAKSAASAVGSQLGRAIIRGVLGSILGKK